VEISANTPFRPLQPGDTPSEVPNHHIVSFTGEGAWNAGLPPQDAGRADEDGNADSIPARQDSRYRVGRHMANLTAGLVTGATLGVMVNLAMDLPAHSNPALPASMIATTGLAVISSAMEELRRHGYLPR
jgi:hypothetical protein